MFYEIVINILDLKNSQVDKENTLIVLQYVWMNSLKILHPFMPFITEVSIIMFNVCTMIIR